MKTICYLDMDDVLADFNGQALKYIQYDCQQIKNKSFAELTETEQAIQKRLFFICDYDNTFWQTMPIRARAVDLYRFCRKQFDEVVLLSKFVPPSCHPHRFRAVSFLKLKWAHHFLSDDYHLPKVIIIDNVKSLLLQNRKDTCQILVDDMTRNISDWEEKGGIGVLYQDNEQVLNALKKIKIQIPSMIVRNGACYPKLKGFSHDKE